MEKTLENGGDGDSTAKISSARGNSKVKFLCSYGGKIQHRPRDQQLTYVGGDTKLLTVDRNIKLCEVVAKLNSLYNFNSEEVYLKYQLPGEEIDSLISLIDDDDLENMMFEYDLLLNRISPSSKPPRFRLFISGINYQAKRNSDSGSDAPLNPDYLFGFDKEYDYSNTKLNGAPSAFDLSLWTIPVKENGIEARKDGSILECAAPSPPQFIYRLPVMNSGFRYGVVPIGVVNGFPERPVFNVVPAVPVAPGQMKTPVSTVDTAPPQRT